MFVYCILAYKAPFHLLEYFFLPSNSVNQAFRQEVYILSDLLKYWKLKATKTGLSDSQT